MTSHNPADGLGAAQAKTSDNRLALDRSAGMSATMGAVASRTASPHGNISGVGRCASAPPTGYGDDNIKT